MLYVPYFLRKIMFLKKCSKGTSNVLQGGGGGVQRSVVKDHTFTFFWDPSQILIRFPYEISISNDLFIHIALYSTVQYSTVQYSTVQYSTVQYSTVQYSTVQYSTVQYSTMVYSYILHCTVEYETSKEVTPSCQADKREEQSRQVEGFLFCFCNGDGYDHDHDEDNDDDDDDYGDEDDDGDGDEDDD